MRIHDHPIVGKLLVNLEPFASFLAILLFIGLIMLMVVVLMGADVPWRGSDDLEDKTDCDGASWNDMEA